MNYSRLRWLEQVLLGAARDQGYDGSPFVEDPIPIQTAEEEFKAVDLAVSVRRYTQTSELYEIARDWTRNIVLTSSGNEIDKAPSSRKRARAW